MLEYNPKSIEDNKYEEIDKKYFNYINELEKLNITNKEIIYNFPLFVGQVNIARNLFFYELYKKVLNLSGDIAEIGTYKGASLLWWTKMISLFEPYNGTQVYGFDWFKGMEPGENDEVGQKDKYQSSYKNLIDLIKMQDLDNIAMVFKMNVVSESEEFIKKDHG